MSAGRPIRLDFNHHDEIWLLLPWLATGRLPEAVRERAERHVEGCIACSAELALQRRLVEALAAPERVSHAPGPSFTRLLRRIDEDTAQRTRRHTSFRMRHAWRPPGFAWATTFLLTSTLAGVLVYRQLLLPGMPWYTTRADPMPPAASVIHISFAGGITIEEMARLLRAAGAQVVTGPGETGIFGVSPVSSGTAGGDAVQRLQELATQLRQDPRVRWVEPVATGLDSTGSLRGTFRP
jgi:hypothetical protein